MAKKELREEKKKELRNSTIISDREKGGKKLYYDD